MININIKSVTLTLFSLLVISIVYACGGGGGDSSGGGSSAGGGGNPSTTALLVGWVRNADTNQFIEGATISRAGLNDTTDIVGSYWIDNSPIGTQILTATATGYADYSNPVNVVEGITNSHNFYMQPLHKVLVPVTKDADVNQYFPNTPAGNSPLLAPTYAANVRRDTLLYAPISAYLPAGAKIIKVEFVGHSFDSAWDYFVAPLLSAWNEDTVTWATRPSQWVGLPEYNASTDGTEYRIDITWPYTSDTYASDALQYGIALSTFENTIFPDWNGIMFSSSEHSTPSQRPLFEVTYID